MIATRLISYLCGGWYIRTPVGYLYAFSAWGRDRLLYRRGLNSIDPYLRHILGVEVRSGAWVRRGLAERAS